MSDHEQAQLLRQVRLALQNNHYEQATGALEQVVKLALDAQDWGAAARHLGNLALAYYRAGSSEAALDAFQRGLVYTHREADRLTESGLLGNMGNILRELGRYDEAIKCLNEALLIAQELGDARGRGVWLSNLGLVYDDLKQAGDACDYHLQAVKIARHLHDQPQLATRLLNLAAAQSLQHAWQAALSSYDEAVAVLWTLGRLEEAHKWAHRSAQIQRRLDELTER